MNFLKRINEKYQIGLIIYIFCFLFAPPLVKNINFVLFVFAYSFIMIIIKYRKKLKETLKSITIKNCIFLLLVYLVMYVISIILNIAFTGEIYLTNYVMNLYSMFIGFIVIFVCALYLIYRLQELGKELDDLIRLFIFAGLIQSLITITTLLSPAIKTKLVRIMFLNTGDILLNTPWIISRRFFGFSNSMLDLFGFGTGLLAVLPLFYSIKHGKKYLACVPLLLLVPLLNSRSGLIMFVIGFIVWFIYILKNKTYKNISKIIVVSLILAVTFIVLLIKFSPNTLDWILKDFGSFIGKGNGTASALFGKDFWTIPPIQSWLMGTGYNVSAYSGFKVENITHSDVGYINEFWKVGIAGSIILYSFITYILIKAYKSSKEKYQKSIFVVFLMSIFVFLIKGTIFTYNPGCVIIYTLALYNLIPNTNRKEITFVEKPLVSIVVPIYNVERYLQKCIDSIMGQTYENLEIILVNDGTLDNSLEICEKNQKLDSRIKVISQENGGLSKARNTGIKNSTGEYICFVDSDDFIDKDYVARLLNGALENGAEICACGFHYVNEKNKILKTKQKENKIYTSIESVKDMLTGVQNTEVMVWNKIYKMSLFTDNNILFPVGKINEDNFIMYKLYDKANKVTLIEDNLYYYLQRNTSIMGKFNKKRLDILEALEQTKEYFKNRNLEEELNCYEVLIQLSLINLMIRNNYYGIEKQNLIDNIIENKDKYLKNNYINTKNRLLIKILEKDISLYSKIILLKK